MQSTESRGRRHYLDHAATTAVRPEALAAFTEAVGLANPSSLHSSGRRARAVVEDAREAVAEALGVAPRRMVFTSGATEADNIAVTGIFAARRSADPARVRILLPASEHKAVLETAAALQDQGAVVERLPLDEGGLLAVEAVAEAVQRDPGSVALVAVMAVNNETGAVQPVAGVVQECHRAGVPVHCDAVQSVAWLPVPAGVDTLALSGHKLGAPMGIGALVLPEQLQFGPHSHGGGQEAGVRSGTVPVALIAALAAAVVAAVGEREQRARHVRRLREELESGLLRLVPDARISGFGRPRAPGICHVWLPECPADTMLMLLDSAGVEVSAGSACTAGIPQPSHVVLAMGGTAKQARESLRLSLGWSSTADDVAAALAALPAAVLRSRAAATTPGYGRSTA